MSNSLLISDLKKLRSLMLKSSKKEDSLGYLYDMDEHGISSLCHRFDLISYVRSESYTLFVRMEAGEDVGLDPCQMNVEVNKLKDLWVCDIDALIERLSAR